MPLIVDGGSVPFAAGESVLVAMLRAGLRPTPGGCLCLAGDCCHCLATIDGVAYTRCCQVPARAGLRVEREHRDGSSPPLVRDERSVAPRPTALRHRWCDVVVIGAGEAGRREAEGARSAGHEVVVLDAGRGQEVVGIYAGPRVVARAKSGMLSLHPRREIVVATGAAEIQPAVPGAELDGLVTARAAEELAGAGIALGHVVALGTPPRGIDVEHVDGELIRFEGRETVAAVIVRAAGGRERRYTCDTVALGLGLHPRDALARMARGLSVPVRTVGDAARPANLPPCPRDGTVCACAGVTVADLDHVWNHGFHELELVKRATLAGTGTCQGSACLPHVRSFLADRGKALQPPFTARPMTRQPTIGEIAAGAFHHPTARTPLDGEHRRLGARMERAGGWWRPWTYGDRQCEYRAVRHAVSLGDVGTLGMFVVSGPDALPFLEHLYPTRVATLADGRSRYALLLDERGYVLDDGLICRQSATRFVLTLTSAGATFGELWLRDWAESGGDSQSGSDAQSAGGTQPGGYDVRILDQTASLGAINVTGPRAAELLQRAGAEALPGFACHGRATVAGIACRVLRLSFTGELSYELHHAAGDSVALWRRLMALGEDLGIHPHGLETLLDLRLEKGHIVVGMDTDFDSTPRRIHHEWAARLDKPAFVGRQALVRTNQEPLDRQLIGLVMPGPAPRPGAVLWHDDRYAGYVTSSFDSPVLGQAVMLGWLALHDGELPTEVTVDGRTARRVPVPFYDPEGARARVKVSANALGSTATGEWERSFRAEIPAARRFARLRLWRVVARAAALDEASWPANARVMRVAGDEVLVDTAVDAPVDAPVDAGRLADPHAIVELETGFAGLWLDGEEARCALAAACAWPWPDERPALAQGAVAEIPVKLWLEAERVLVLVPAAYAVALEERLGSTLSGRGER